MRLYDFIVSNMEEILQEWEDFAKTIFQAVQTKKTLRDHAKKMLLVISLDLQQEQSVVDQISKSKGHQLQDALADTAAEEHGIARMEEGFSINEIAAEYRALRASVTKLWGHAKKAISARDINDLIRFNEAIDQSLNESIDSYALLKEQQTRHFNTMLASSPDLSYIIDTAGLFLYVNQAMSELYQKPAHDMVGKLFYDLEKNLKPEERADIQSVLDTGNPCRGDRVFSASSGKDYFFEYIYTPIFDEHGTIEAIAGNSRDITERKLAEEKIAKLANTDALTGLPNRRLFTDRLEHAIKEVNRDNSLFALLSIDLDGFKKVNDRLGHEIGDLLLQQVGMRIRACVRDVDTVARMGGDEFTVILHHVNNPEQAKIISEKILVELANPFQVKLHRIDLSASLGIALSPLNGIEAVKLLGYADKAMYVAKNSGRNQCSFYRSSE